MGEARRLEQLQCLRWRVNLSSDEGPRKAHDRLTAFLELQAAIHELLGNQIPDDRPL